MRYETRQVRVGELLGPVDWDYDFRSHYDSRCCSDDQRDEACERGVQRLRLLSQDPDKYEATNYGGWPRCGWGRIIAIGMYDGWPYWRPVPSVRLTTPLGGGEWHSFDSITDIRELTEVLNQ